MRIFGAEAVVFEEAGGFFVVVAVEDIAVVVEVAALVVKGFHDLGLGWGHSVSGG